MSNEDLYVELAKHTTQIAKLMGQVAALEDIVYKREGAKPQPLPVEKILMELDVSLSDRLEIVSENEVRAREYFHQKDEWSTVNKVLKQHGFKWVSQGKDSHWSRQ